LIFLNSDYAENSDEEMNFLKITVKGGDRKLFYYSRILEVSTYWLD
jgi:hypothetical protein